MDNKVRVMDNLFDKSRRIFTGIPGGRVANPSYRSLSRPKKYTNKLALDRSLAGRMIPRDGLDGSLDDRIAATRVRLAMLRGKVDKSRAAFVKAMAPSLMQRGEHWRNVAPPADEEVVKSTRELCSMTKAEVLKWIASLPPPDDDVDTKTSVQDID